MQRLPRMPRYKDRRKAQAGTTLVELLVSLVIMGMALVLVVGTFSTGLLDSTIAKRNTAVQAVIQYELDKVSATQPFDNGPEDYSECFATENLSTPFQNAAAGDPCPGPPGRYTLRADVVPSSKQASSQVWTVTVVTWPAQSQVGDPVSVVKVNR